MDYRINLKKLRIAAGLTQGELTDRAGLNGSQAIKMAELGHQHLNGKDIEDLSRALGVPVCQILTNGCKHK